MDFIRQHFGANSNHPRRPGTNHHYVFSGKIHVRVATLIIITVRIFFTLLFAAHFLMSNKYEYKTVDAVYEIFEVTTVTLLVVGFLRKESNLMWPFMAVEFTWVIVIILTSTLTVMAKIFPSTQTQTIILIPSLRLAALGYIFAVVSIIEIYILLACNRYFDDEKLYRSAPIARPIIRNQNPLTSDDQSFAADNSKSFENPNFIPDNAVSLDMDDIDDDENGWHRADAKAGVIA